MRANETKARVVALYEIMSRGGWYTRKQLEDKLDNEYGICVPDRRAIYDDINVLTLFLPIETKRGRREAKYGWGD